MAEENTSTKANHIPLIGCIVGILLFLFFLSGPAWGFYLEEDNPALNSMIAITLLMACLWLTEAIPMAATALIPLALFPLLQIQPATEVAQNYGSRFIFLFLGGFFLALAIEESGLHRRVALWIVLLMGDRPRRIILGFMLATALLSMWISNTATSLLMLPIAVSVIGQIEQEKSKHKNNHDFAVALLLGIAYSASIGGCATLIGTPPNIRFADFFETTYPAAEPISFAAWLILALPYAAVFLILCWLVLARLIFQVSNESSLGGNQVIHKALNKLGPLKKSEERMMIIFGLTAVLWILREPWSGFGWAPALGLSGWVDDGTTAMLMSLVCFFAPAGKEVNSRLLTWEDTKRVPWGVLLLFGGGVALAAGMKQTGLDLWLGQYLAASLKYLSEDGMIAVSATGMVWLTELTSNLASINMLLPILDSTSQQLKVDPLLLMLPATLAASCAFMMPVATPPNAIIYGSGRVPMRQMIKAGLVLNLVSSLLIYVAIKLLVPLAFG